MLKKILASTFLLVLLSGIVSFLYYFRETKRPVSSAIRAIPASAALIIETRQTHESWKKLSETNIIWEELLQVEYLSRLNNEIRILDSLYLLKPGVKEIFTDHSLFISAHMTEEKKFNFLFLFIVPPSVGSNAIYMLSKENSAGYIQTEKEYDGAVITAFHSPENNFSFTVYNDIFIGSFNAMLVEDAVRQINSGVSLQDDFAFNKVACTSGEKADVNFYINHRFFPQMANVFTREKYAPFLLSLKNFADWTALDLKIKPNVLLLNGFTFSNDSLNKFLNFFKQQKPQEAGFTGIIPFNTAAFFHFGFSNFSAFYKEYDLYLENGAREEKISAVNKECHCDVQKALLSWVENEMAVVITEPTPGNEFPGLSEEERNAPPNFFAIFKSNNMDEAKRLLATVADSVARDPGDTVFDYEIKKLKFPGIYPLLLGNLFSNIRSGFFSITEDYIVFANENGALRDFASHYKSEKTLSGNLNYTAFSENLSSESNLFIYSNINRSSGLFGQYISREYLEDFDENKELFRKFEAVAIQYSSDNNDLFYNNVFLKYNPVYKQETATLWETRLDTVIYTMPFLVTNHYSGTKEIFVQDNANNIYLISGKGKILWKRPLPEKIEGRVSQVDGFKNNKLQMLFNTSSFLFLIDRNGKDVAGFPVKLKAPAANEVSVLDYERNKNYRLVIACKDSLLHNFEINGQPVKGWEFPKLKSPMSRPVRYFSLEGKDYLVGIDDIGNVYAFDRSGKSRINVKAKIPVSANSDFFIEPGKNIGKTRLVSTDSSGNIIRLYFGGNIENIRIDNFSDKHFFAYHDINNDKSAEYIFLDKNELRVYSQDQLRYSIFNYRFDADIVQKPGIFEFPGNLVRIGIADSKSGKIYLFEDNGTQPEGFPLLGSTLFSVGDLNRDGELYLVTGSGSNVFTYLLK